MPQQQVNLYPAAGVPGAPASVNTLISTAVGYIAEQDINIGGFCFPGSAGNLVKAAGAAGAPAGFVLRETSYSIVGYREAGQAFVPRGQNVSVMVRGDFYAVAATDAAAGQKAFARRADGAVVTGAAGATVTGAVETAFTVIKGGDAGELIIISNW